MPNTPSEVQLNVRIDAVLRRDIRIACLQRGITLESLLDSLLRRWLDRNKDF